MYFAIFITLSVTIHCLQVNKFQISLLNDNHVSLSPPMHKGPPPLKYTEAELKNDPQALHKEFISRHGRSYSPESEEGKTRFANFKKNVDECTAHNIQNLSYKKMINDFSDWSPEEFNSIHGHKEPQTKSLIKRQRRLVEKSSTKTKKQPPATWTAIDWTSMFQTPRNQGTCGCCWAFATAGIMEAYYFKKNPSVTPFYLSTQQLIDCSATPAYGNSGCNGGSYFANNTSMSSTKINGVKTVTTTFSADQGSAQYNIDFGLVPDTQYPFTATQAAQCNAAASANPVAKSVGYSWAQNLGNAAQTTNLAGEANIYAMLQNGPMAVVIDGTAIKNYSSGVFSTTCVTVNHGVVMVGFGIDPQFGAYFKIRNSWGATWGESGYLRVAYNPNNQSSCFTATKAYAPNF